MDFGFHPSNFCEVQATIKVLMIILAAVINEQLLCDILRHIRQHPAQRFNAHQSRPLVERKIK